MRQQQNLYTMKHIYNIKEQTENEIRTFFSTTTKREIESMFNRLMKSFSKDSHYMVERIRMGYCKVTLFGVFGNIETEYWIERA